MIRFCVSEFTVAGDDSGVGMKTGQERLSLCGGGVWKHVGFLISSLVFKEKAEDQAGPALLGSLSGS